MLELANVSKKYDDVTALAPLSLKLDAERTFVLLGTSGCGKSTLLKLILGLVVPDSGEVRFAGELLGPDNVLETRRRIGYVIQDGGLFPHLTAHENVTLVARHVGRSEPEMQQRVIELAELTHLPLESLDRYPAQLSGGQQQRVGLMRALMLDPDVLLLDEPLGALDPIIRRELQEDLRQIFRSLKKTVVMVTHDLYEAAYFADEILLMRAGSIVQQGAIQELVDSPADDFVAKFVSAQRTTLTGVPE